MRKSGRDCRSAKHVHVTCAEDATMNEGKQCLQRAVTGSRCLEDGCGKIMLDVCCVLTSFDENIATDKIGNECQLSANMLLLGKFFNCGRGSVVPAKILSCR